MEGRNSNNSGGSLSSTGAPRKKQPRLYHKKSKTGCERCRARRVKCDEKRPLCNDCTRHNVPCIYRHSIRNSSKSPTSSRTLDDDSTKPRVDLLQDYREVDFPSPLELNLHEELALETASYECDESDIFDITESKSRRLLELRLLQNYIETSKTFGASHHEAVRRAWSIGITKLALQHENLLYQIFSISTLHLLKSEPNRSELIIARQRYQGLALREQRRAIAKLTSENADAICCTASLILLDAFASLQEREIEPYSPPTQWLHMARGAGSVFSIGLERLKQWKKFDTSNIIAIGYAQLYFQNPNLLFVESNRKDLVGLLTQDIPGETWDPETQHAYEKTLSLIGWIQLAIDDGENNLGICRRMMSFAILAPKKFIEFVEEMRPRSLVILAYFFALGSQMTDIWWIGEAVPREILGIRRVLPSEWQPFMRLPLMKAGFM